MPPPIMSSRIGHPIVHFRSVTKAPDWRHFAKVLIFFHCVTVKHAIDRAVQRTCYAHGIMTSQN